MFNMGACTRGLYFAYLSAHVRVMIKGAFHQFGPVHLANKLRSMRVRETTWVCWAHLFKVVGSKGFLETLDNPSHALINHVHL